MLIEIPISEVGGFRVGHAQNMEAGTGCTVILPDKMSPAGADYRGGGPASRESQLLSPLTMAEGVHGILLSGGSAFGLDAAGGVQRYLEERGIGFDTGYAKVPLVCSSCLYDLSVGRADVRPDAGMAYAACLDAETAGPIPEGNVGAGCGCSIGKMCGMDRAMKSGFGTYAVRVGALKLGAMVAVNALGDVWDGDSPVAGLRNESGTGLDSTRDRLLEGLEAASLADGPPPDLWEAAGPVTNTTLGVVVTNAAFSKAQLCKLAGMTHNGYARAIRPVHTMADGDTIYALSLGTLTADISAVGTLAAYVMEKAILRAVRAAEPAFGLPACADPGESGGLSL